MSRKSDAELQDYVIHNTNYQEEAVLAAIWELEKRNQLTDDTNALKIKLEAQDTETLKQEATTKEHTLELYSYNFIVLFGVLFSVFAGSILIGLNLIALKDKPHSRLAVLSGFGYSFLQVYLMDAFKITSSFVGVLSSLVGIYLLYHYFIKPKLKPDTTYPTRNIWQPLLIAILISLPIAYFMMKSMGVS